MVPSLLGQEGLMDIDFLMEVGRHCEAVLSNAEAMLKERGMELRSHCIDRTISHEVCGSTLTGEEVGVLAGIMLARSGGAVCG